MTPDQLERAATKLRARTPKPSLGMSPGDFHSATVIWAFAESLDEIAAEDREAQDGPRCGKPFEGDFLAKGCRMRPEHDGTCGPF